MNFNRNQAKALTNTKELDLYDMARPPKLNKISVKELENLVKRSRTLRDKLRDVKRTQVRSTQSKTKARGASPADRSEEKAELFSEVHDTFVARLAKVQTADASVKVRPAAKKPTKTDKNIETRTDRTGVRQKLKAVKKSAKRPGVTSTEAASEATKPTKPKAKKILASAARVAKAASATKGKGRSTKASFASKAAADPERTVLETPQSAARRPDPVGKVEQGRISRSGITRKRGHLSAQNKRRQGKRDSK